MPSANAPAAVFDLGSLLAALGIAQRTGVGGEPYAVIHGRDGPRWLVPVRSHFAHAVLQGWRPYSLSARASWSLLCLAARAGALRSVPGVASTVLPSDASRQLLRFIGANGSASAPLILLGNQSPTRKLIVFLQPHNAAGIQVVKLPLGPLAAVSILHEASTLRSLDGRSGAPRLLHLSAEPAASIQQYLPGRLGSRRIKPAYLQLLAAMARGESAISLSDRASQLRHSLAQHQASAPHAAQIHALFALLNNDARLPATLVHGDFAPWNIREDPQGAVSLIDWESADANGLPLHDLCHFFYMQARLFAPQSCFYQSMAQSRSLGPYLAATGLPASLAPALAAAFLLATLDRSLSLRSLDHAQFCLAQSAGFLRSCNNASGQSGYNRSHQ